MTWLNIFGIAACVIATWFISGCWLTYRLYIGYGFVMNAQDAANNGRSQAIVIKVDSFIAFQYVLIDAYLNFCFFSVMCWDFRRETTINLVTGRLCQYNNDPTTGPIRMFYVDLFAAFLDGKDIWGGYDHIKGINRVFDWLGPLKSRVG